MFENKFQWYETMGAKLDNVKLRFEKGGSDPIPGLTSKKNFDNEKETIMTFPLDFVISEEEMTKIPANAHLKRL